MFLAAWPSLGGAVTAVLAAGVGGLGSSRGRAVLNRHHVFCLGSKVNRGVLAVTPSNLQVT